MDTYNQKAIAIILNINDNDNVSLVTKELIDFIKQVETDDRIYLYNKTGFCFDQKSEAVAILANYDFKQPIEFLIKDAIASLKFEDFSCGELDKNIYIFNDNLSFQNYHVNKVLNLCKVSKCKTHVFETTQYFENSYKLETFEGVAAILIKVYNEST